MRVALCWIGISGYLAACWRELCSRSGMDVKIFFAPGIGTADAPFKSDITNDINAEALTPEQAADVNYVASRVLDHKPDVVVIPGWVIPGYTALPFNPALAHAKFIMGIDTPRKYDPAGRIRQQLGRLKLRKLIKRMDRIIVPGERSWQYARFLGFDESQIRRGVYAADVANFVPILSQRLAQPGGWPRRFLFTGRYVHDKAIDILIPAYQRYRQQHPSDAWPLICCGIGPMGDLIRAAGAGVEDKGFLQPTDLPAVWASCGVLVLPSRYEPWGVVLVEACAAGLPILCTESCGASVEMVRSHYNGLTVATADVADLARGLSFMHANYDRLEEMGRRGQPMAAAYTPQLYADRWSAMFRELSPDAAP